MWDLPDVSELVTTNYYDLGWLLLCQRVAQRPPQCLPRLKRGKTLILQSIAATSTGWYFCTNRLCEDVLTHPYQHASVCGSCTSVQTLAVPAVAGWNTCFLHCLDRSKPACSLLCAFRIRTSGTCTLWIIKLHSRLESSRAMLGTHKMFAQWCRDELI